MPGEVTALWENLARAAHAAAYACGWRTAPCCDAPGYQVQARDPFFLCRSCGLTWRPSADPRRAPGYGAWVLARANALVGEDLPTQLARVTLLNHYAKSLGWRSRAEGGAA